LRWLALPDDISISAFFTISHSLTSLENGEQEMSYFLQFGYDASLQLPCISELPFILKGTIQHLV